MGCPVIGTNSGGTPELIQHERNGLLCEPGSPEDAAKQMIRLLQNPTMAQDLGRKALEDTRKRYNPSKLASETLAFYRMVLGEQKE